MNQLFSAGARQGLAVLELGRHEHAAGFPVPERPERHRDPHAGLQRRPASSATD
jgi:hypothetical protein